MDTTGPRDVHLRLLGGFEVHVDGEQVAPEAFAGRRSLELVQLLALHDGRLVADQVVDALWPHLGGAAGRANLRKAAHHARRALGHADAVVLRGGSVHLAPAAEVHIDVRDLRHAAADALASGDPARSAAVAAAHPGELLPASPYEEWTLGPRDELRALRCRLLEHAERWTDVLALDPLHERAHVALMEDALATGARADALRWYERLRTTLRRELGVAPGPAAQAAYAAAIAGADADGCFVGRHDALALAATARRRALDGSGGALVVRAVAGLGRTAVCSRLARDATADGWTATLTVRGRADGAYATVVAIVEAVVALAPTAVDGLDEHSRAVLRVLTPAAGPAPALRGPNSRHQVIGAIRRLVLAASDGGPVLVLVDDAHLADDASIEVLGHLAASGPPLLVGWSRVEAMPDAMLDDALDRLGRAGRLTTIVLDALTRDEATELAHDAADRTLAPDELAAVLDRAGGQPAFVIELARAIAAGGIAAAAARPIDAVQHRLSTLEAGVRSALARMALAGAELDTTTAVAMVGGDEPSAFAALDAALAAGLLVVQGDRYRFRHDVVREALLAAVAPHHHAAVHADAARRLAARGAPAATVARHWLAAGRPTDATEWLVAAAREAMAASAFADARRGAERVLAHDPGHPEARRIRAEAMDATGDLGTLGAYDAAIATAPARDVDDLRAARALAQIKMGDAAGALVAIAGVQPRTVAGKLCEALTYSGAAALGFADPAMGTRKAAESRRLALESGDEAAIVIASWAQAAAAHARGELRDSVLADLRDTKDLPHLAVRVFDGHLCFTQRFLYGSRPYDDVIAFADGLAAEARRLGAARGHAFGVQLRGEAELLSGRLDAAEVDLLEGGRLHRSIAGAVGEAHALQRLAELAMIRGQHAQAANLLDEALDVARATDIGFHLLDRIYGTRIALATEVDRDAATVAVDEAEAAVRGPLETCPGCRIAFAMPAGIACARAGDVARAVAYEQLNTYLADVVMRLPAWDAALLELRAHLAAATGDLARAGDGFVAAATGFARAGQPVDAARCRAFADPHAR